ncbi:MAG TPA: hypothetical protein IGS53_12635 [Leptolyngbyaceae cyanobacterium M33_DOE_097]|uniref:DUF2281 domain-containing protein n=1 Tax=Oscillatoriales cyanobacterium SpSt-418 TaxID=2282169 RepID=A0A7C3KH38_9CYAN|nr:hypothetical protein [Leptolyngbyaceae cyanobacterium M33_DOE_097]
MATKEQILQELENAPEPLLGEFLRYLQRLKDKHREEMETAEDLADLQAIRTEIAHEGTLSWKTVKHGLGLL